MDQLGGEEDIIYLQLSEVALEEAEPFFDRAPLDVVGDVGGRVGHDAHGGGTPLGEERLEAQLELCLLLEVERVDLSEP